MAQGFVYQVNLQESLGGGEVYTRFLTRALASLGWRTKLFVNPLAEYWPGLALPQADLIPVASIGDIEQRLEGERPLVLAHTALPAILAERLARRAVLAGIVHMPLYERLPEGLHHYRLLLCVSAHVAASARARGLANLYAEPLLGVADLAPRGASPGAIVARSVYDWDRRKLRDRLFGWMEARSPRFFAPRRFERIGDFTLGIVSRLTPIKQYPLMFSFLAPVLARFPRVRVEIFGSGGYASVRDLKAALRPCEAQVRFWGHQPDVARVYPLLDYVLSGLPEKEALGLNLIEAQASGTPALAVADAPFTETVLEGQTGFLFPDPRQDAGRGFAVLIERLLGGTPRPDPRLARTHLERFSERAFRTRVAGALDRVLDTA